MITSILKTAKNFIAKNINVSMIELEKMSLLRQVSNSNPD